ncbi:hypothetical protein [Sinomonas sp. RB5]
MSPEAWLGVLLSVPAALAATAIWLVGALVVDRVRFGRVDIKGAWAEWVESGDDRCFSVGVIERRAFTSQYVFDGTNYHNDGRPFCYWRTVKSHFGQDKSEYIYVFATKDVTSLQTTSYGYGVVNLASDGKSLVPAGGFYMYSVGTNTALQRDHTLKRADKNEIPKPGENAAKFLARTFPAEWSVLNPLSTIDEA